MIAVIIPAHDESQVIGRSLSSMGLDSVAEEIKVAVVCNGCADNTAELAMRAYPPVKVIETSTASKSNALNLGDEAISGFPRFYVDADVELPIESIREVARVLAEGEVLAAAPLMRADLNGRPWSVRAFYRVWLALPYCRQGMIGSGVYAVSEEGRKRWGCFPDITADDVYARLHFRPEERLTVQSCHFTIRAPRTLRNLIAIKTRGHFGNLELKAKYPQLWVNEDARHGRALLRLALRPWWWPAIAVYCLVRVIARRRAAARFRSGDHKLWERDESSRVAEVQSA